MHRVTPDLIIHKTATDRRWEMSHSNTPPARNRASLTAWKAVSEKRSFGKQSQKRHIFVSVWSFQSVWQTLTHLHTLAVTSETMLPINIPGRAVRHTDTVDEIGLFATQIRWMKSGCAPYRHGTWSRTVRHTDTVDEVGLFAIQTRYMKSGCSPHRHGGWSRAVRHTARHGRWSRAVHHTDTVRWNAKVFHLLVRRNLCANIFIAMYYY